VTLGSKRLGSISLRSLSAVSARLLVLALELKTVRNTALTLSTLSASSAVRSHCGSVGARRIFVIHVTELLETIRLPHVRAKVSATWGQDSRITPRMERSTL
jgi:hypothetical protein